MGKLEHRLLWRFSVQYLRNQITGYLNLSYDFWKETGGRTQTCFIAVSHIILSAFHRYRVHWFLWNMFNILYLLETVIIDYLELSYYVFWKENGCRTTTCIKVRFIHMYFVVFHREPMNRFWWKYYNSYFISVWNIYIGYLELFELSYAFRK